MIINSQQVHVSTDKMTPVGSTLKKNTDFIIMTCTVMSLLDLQHQLAVVNYTLVCLYAVAAWFLVNKQQQSIGKPLLRQ